MKMGHWLAGRIDGGERSVFQEFFELRRELFDVARDLVTAAFSP
jgi:hypothetical protein